MIPKWQFLRDNSTICSPPNQTGWQEIIKSFMIRSSCRISDTPTTPQFTSGPKTPVVCGISKGYLKGGNSEADNAKLLNNFSHLFTGLHQQLNQPGMHERTSLVVNINSVIEIPALADEIKIAIWAGSHIFHSLH
ncbi:hypothetical protein Zmor_014241 [Zophobas morio]|uniref:Uncharacterized protein n=1 Tax=Zophobas morio TaxID=2755281 RepID=A0AA38IHE5_9CUCU|nr:hypothetical protein Zmor_014241 [Zophobas morio]